MNDQSKAFSKSRLIADLQSTCAAIGAPFSETSVSRVLDGYSPHFSSSVIVLKTTDRPGDHLYYRLWARSRLDTIEIALKCGLLPERTELSSLIDSWSALYSAAEQSCEFDASSGLTKTWIHLGDLRPIGEILGNGFVPESIRRHLPLFQRSNFLEYVRFVAVDHGRRSVNIYFRARGPMTAEKFAFISGVVDADPPDLRLVAEMRKYASTDFSLGFTLSMETGEFERACIYAVNIPMETWTNSPVRLTDYYAKAPCYDEKSIAIAGWSFGGGGNYIKLEKAYCGDLASLLPRWGSIFSGSTYRDAVFEQE
jgi:4-hydroxyphenylpyruvate 3-dimethylallyltransferase